MSGLSTIKSIKDLGLGKTILGMTGSKNKKTKTQGPIDYRTSDYSGYNQGIYDTLMSGGGSWSGGVYRPDTSSAIAAYNKQADTARALAKSQYDTTRNDLLTQMERFRESNAKSRTNQKQSYLTNQSALDLAKEQADRQSRISNAARGLGGSGLQNLAELQNDLGMQQDVSKLANENQSILDALTTELKNKQEDTDKGIKNAETNYNNTLKSIASDLASKIAQVNYEADQIYNQSLANARASYNNASANATGTANYLTNTLNNSATSLVNLLKNTSKSDLAKQLGLNKKASSKTISNTLYNKYMDQLSSLSQQGLTSNAAKQYANDIKRILNSWSTYR